MSAKTTIGSQLLWLSWRHRLTCLPNAVVGFLNAQHSPKELRPALKELVEMASWDWHTGWGALTKFGENLMRKEGITQNDLRRLHRFIKSLARFRDDGADQILALLKRQYRGTNKNLMVWMEPWIVELAGHMRIKEAIPFIIERFYERR